MKKQLTVSLLSAVLLPAMVLAQSPKKDPAERGGADYITGKAPRTLKGGWVLDWNDEFNGSKLDESKWAYELGVVRNHGSSQAYCKDCVKVKGGKLLLRSVARKTKCETYDPEAKKWPKNVKVQPYGSG